VVKSLTSILKSLSRFPNLELRQIIENLI
jgi:hypothetical protein